MRALLMRAARSRWGGPLIGLLFTHMSFAIPAERLVETDTLLAFPHPIPLYPTHVLILPKRNIGGLEELSTADADFMVDLFAAVKQLTADWPGGYRLIANGSAYQEVGHLHFHLISGEPLPSVDS